MGLENSSLAVLTGVISKYTKSGAMEAHQASRAETNMRV